jgi:hypothetical protein
MSKQESFNEPEHNPYAPPRTDIRPLAENAASESEDRRPVGRETIIRIGGLIGLILAGLVFVVFGLGFLSEFKKIAVAEGQIDPWKYRVYISRMASTISVCLLAAVTNWGLFRLRRWGRWALTCATVLPVPVMSLCYLMIRGLTRLEAGESIFPWRLAIITMGTSIYWIHILFLLWSPKGMAVFSRGYTDARRRGARKGAGCFPVIGAFGFAFAQGISYTALVLSVLSLLEFVGLLPSI